MAEKLKLIATGENMSPEAEGASCLVRVWHKTTPDSSRMYVEFDQNMRNALRDDALPVADKTELRDTICEAIRRAFNDAMRLQ